MGLSQSELAALLDCSNTHLSNVELGRRLPSFELLSRFEGLAGGTGLLRSMWEWAYTERAASRVTGVPEILGNQIPGDRAEFVRDVTVHDGTAFASGERFTKVWRIKNAGIVEWVGRSLQRAGPQAPRFGPWSPAEAAIPTTKPGSEVNVRIPMRAPMLPGDCVAYFYMVDAEGRLCFPNRTADGVYVRIFVRNPASLRS